MSPVAVSSWFEVIIATPAGLMIAHKRWWSSEQPTQHFEELPGTPWARHLNDEVELAMDGWAAQRGSSAG